MNKVYYVDGGSHSQFLQLIFTHNSKNLNTSLPMNIRGKEEEEAKEAWTQISSQSRHWFPSAGRAAVSAALLKLKKNIKQKVLKKKCYVQGVFVTVPPIKLSDGLQSIIPPKKFSVSKFPCWLALRALRREHWKKSPGISLQLKGATYLPRKKLYKQRICGVADKQ